MPAVVSIAVGVALIVWRDAVAELIARDQLNHGAQPSAQSPRDGRIAVILVATGFVVLGVLRLLGIIGPPAP